MKCVVSEPQTILFDEAEDINFVIEGLVGDENGIFEVPNIPTGNMYWSRSRLHLDIS